MWLNFQAEFGPNSGSVTWENNSGILKFNISFLKHGLICTYLDTVIWLLNEITHVKYLTEFFAHSRFHVNTVIILLPLHLYVGRTASERCRRQGTSRGPI